MFEKMLSVDIKWFPCKVIKLSIIPRANIEVVVSLLLQEIPNLKVAPLLYSSENICELPLEEDVRAKWAI